MWLILYDSFKNKGDYNFPILIVFQKPLGKGTISVQFEIQKQNKTANWYKSYAHKENLGGRKDHSSKWLFLLTSINPPSALWRDLLVTITRDLNS